MNCQRGQLLFSIDSRDSFQLRCPVRRQLRPSQSRLLLRHQVSGQRRRSAQEQSHGGQGSIFTQPGSPVCSPGFGHQSTNCKPPLDSHGQRDHRRRRVRSPDRRARKSAVAIKPVYTRVRVCVHMASIKIRPATACLDATSLALCYRSIIIGTTSGF